MTWRLVAQSWCCHTSRQWTKVRGRKYIVSSVVHHLFSLRKSSCHLKRLNFKMQLKDKTKSRTCFSHVFHHLRVPLVFFLLNRSTYLWPRASFSCSLIQCELIAPHMGGGTRLVSILIMVCGSAMGNRLPICSQRICQMIGVYTAHPLRRVCHNATSYISITYLILNQPKPLLDKMLTLIGVWRTDGNIICRYF